MEEAEGIPPTASTVVPGLSLNYLGSHVYGYSGQISVDSTLVSLIDSISGTGYIVAKVQFNYGAIDDASDFEYVILFNEVKVFIYTVTGAHQSTASEPDNYINIIIPPFTRVQLGARRRTGSSAQPQFAILTGRVYDA